MHGAINVKSPNNTSEWQMGFNSAFKGLSHEIYQLMQETPRKYTKPTYTLNDPSEDPWLHVDGKMMSRIREDSWA
jgi:hypothetical protein